MMAGKLAIIAQTKPVLRMYPRTITRIQLRVSRQSNGYVDADEWALHTNRSVAPTRLFLSHLDPRANARGYHSVAAPRLLSSRSERYNLSPRRQPSFMC